jgi:hypothetical protein
VGTVVSRHWFPWRSKTKNKKIAKSFVATRVSATSAITPSEEEGTYHHQQEPRRHQCTMHRQPFVFCNIMSCLAATCKRLSKSSMSVQYSTSQHWIAQAPTHGRKCSDELSSSPLALRTRNVRIRVFPSWRSLLIRSLRYGWL